MTPSTYTRITLTNAIVAAGKLGASVVFRSDALTALLESMDKDDVVLFDTKQIDPETFAVSLHDK